MTRVSAKDPRRHIRNGILEGPLVIRYVTGDATRPQGEGPRVIVHVCNDVGGWGAGFVVAISRRWKEPEAGYRRWHRARSDEGAGPFELGAVQYVEVEPQLWVANLVGQHGLSATKGVPPVRYDAIRAGLGKVAAFAREHAATVHMPKIGAGLAGGDWDRISKVIENELDAKGVGVTVYTLPAAAPR
jgi:O-acetyl-ADP-ribose deacetylase (regulator of RNase III)